MLEEQLEIVSGLWAADTPFSHAGEHYTLTDSPALPKPNQRPGPPIVIGGAGQKRTPQLAARFGAEWNLPFSPLPGFVAGRERVRAACESLDRDPDSIVTSAAQVVCIGENEADIARRAAAIGREVTELRQNGLCGTPSEIVDRLGDWAAGGAERAYLQILDLSDLDHVALIGEQILPAVA
jgi:alkanesulfonate monooxygenase SsuD/methylene tetrahydromethanopterin reductase-like flavin-dependent oxidoreductase (luciferase family)